MFARYEIPRALSAWHVRTSGLAIKFVMCERLVMDTIPGTAELSKAMGISKSYASEIVNNVRTPSRALAFRIYRQMGWKPPNIAMLSDEDIAALERLEKLVA